MSSGVIHHVKYASYKTRIDRHTLQFRLGKCGLRSVIVDGVTTNRWITSTSSVAGKAITASERIATAYFTELGL